MAEEGAKFSLKVPHFLLLRNVCGFITELYSSFFSGPLLLAPHHYLDCQYSSSGILHLKHGFMQETLRWSAFLLRLSLWSTLYYATIFILLKIFHYCTVPLITEIAWFWQQNEIQLLSLVYPQPIPIILSSFALLWKDWEQNCLTIGCVFQITRMNQEQ